MMCNGLYNLRVIVLRVYLIKEFVTVIAGAIMDYSGLCLCSPSNFEAMEEQGLSCVEDADYLSFPGECKQYLSIFLNTKEKWIETVIQRKRTQMVIFNGGNI